MWGCNGKLVESEYDLFLYYACTFTNEIPIS